jgi:hypothetical protein
MGTAQLHATPGQPLAQRVRVPGVVIEHALGLLARPPWAMAGHGTGIHGRGPARPPRWGSPSPSGCPEASLPPTTPIPFVPFPAGFCRPSRPFVRGVNAAVGGGFGPTGLALDLEWGEKGPPGFEPKA